MKYYKWVVKFKGATDTTGFEVVTAGSLKDALILAFAERIKKALHCDVESVDDGEEVHCDVGLVLKRGTAPMEKCFSKA